MLLTGAGPVDESLDSITVDELREHANVLASDTFEGREAGRQGGQAAGAYVVTELKKTGIEPGGDDGDYYQHFGNGYRNILAVLPGTDDSADEVIIIGAHYDHVGYGNPTNSFGPFGKIHNGADDNASGVAALLEIIQGITERGIRFRRTVLFAFWDAEEKGLLGSQHWVNRPTIALDRIRLLINVDMIGRLQDDTVEVLGVRTAPGLRELASRANDSPALRLRFNWNIIRDSDHYPFVQRRIPYLMAFTGKHDDYHRPSDDVDRLNLDGMHTMTRFLHRLVSSAADADTFPVFRQRSRVENENTRRHMDSIASSRQSRLGVSWDWGPDERYVVVTGVIQSSPAHRADLRPGDRILRIGPFATHLADFRTLVMAAPSASPLVVQRDPFPNPLQLNVQLLGEPMRLGLHWREDDGEPGCVIVTDVVVGSPAQLAGVQQGDRIHAVNGRSIADSAEFAHLISELNPQIVLETERHGRIRDMKADLSMFVSISRAKDAAK